MLLNYIQIEGDVFDDLHIHGPDSEHSGYIILPDQSVVFEEMVELARKSLKELEDLDA
jgi:hypothetical protein